jgi:DNA-directed RNA polymerase subunit RPC12/RpoP
MDITFTCTHCHQVLEVDSSASGSKIDCPSCGHKLVVPELDPTNIHHLNPTATSAAAREEKHFSVPVGDSPSTVLIEKPLPTLEESKDGDKKMRVRCIKRTECIEVGRDNFEKVVSTFLDKVGPDNIVSISPINYSHIDMGTRQILTDFGVMIVYKG